jgi:hypothetical protein
MYSQKLQQASNFKHNGDTTANIAVPDLTDQKHSLTNEADDGRDRSREKSCLSQPLDEDAAQRL